MKLDKFVLGSNRFQASGVSRLKVCQQESGRTRADYVEIPIQSISVSEALALSGNAPTPPSIKVVQQDGNAVKAPDYGDKSYLKRKADFDQDLGFAIISLGLAVVFEDDNGKEITEPKKRIECLKTQGFSQAHFQELIRDIQNLTTSNEKETEDFFSEDSDVPSTN